MRLLVVDTSLLMPWLVGQVVPAGVTVEIAGSYADALSILGSRPPACVVLGVSPAPGPWDEVMRACEAHEPPIPYLKSATVEPPEPSAPPFCPVCGRARVWEKAGSLETLRDHVTCLLDHAACPRGGT